MVYKDDTHEQVDSKQVNSFNALSAFAQQNKTLHQQYFTFITLLDLWRAIQKQSRLIKDRKVDVSPILDLACCFKHSESPYLWLLEGVAAVEQHVGICRWHKAVLYLPDHWVVKTVPGTGQSIAAQSCVVTHVHVTWMVLEKERVYVCE